VEGWIDVNYPKTFTGYTGSYSGFTYSDDQTASLVMNVQANLARIRYTVTNDNIYPDDNVRIAYDGSNALTFIDGSVPAPFDVTQAIS
jgi:hypothetical protein